MSAERPHLQGSEERKIGLIRNPVSLIGAALAATSLATIAFLFFVNFVSVRPSPYIGVLPFMVAPAFFDSGPCSHPPRTAAGKAEKAQRKAGRDSTVSQG